MKKIDGKWWENIIIGEDAMFLARRIKFFMEEGIPYRIEFCKGIYGEQLINLLYLPPEEGIDVIKLWSIGKEED